MATERKKGDKGVARTELVAVRFDPRTKFALDIASRIQRRSIANYVEAAVAESFKTTIDADGSSVEGLCRTLWHISEPMRLAQLAKTRNHLLTYDEQKLVKLAKTVGIALGIQGTDEAQAELIQPHWDYIKEAAAADTPFQEVLEAVQAHRTGGPVTVERIDKRMEVLNAKHKADVAWLLAKKRELEGVSDDPRTAEPDGLSSRDLNTVGPTRARLGAPNATASARLVLGEPNTVKADGSSVRLGQPKPKATK